MVITQQDIEAQLSYAYLHAIASHAGCVCRQATAAEDKEGIDAALTAYGEFPGTYRTQVTLNVQLKATIQPLTDDGTHLSYFIQGIRRYDELRKDHREPIRLLVVLLLPQDHADWVSCSPDQLVLRRCAYWVSLRNAPATDNSSGQTVKIPKSQLLTTQSLEELVWRVATCKQTDLPSYIAP